MEQQLRSLEASFAAFQNKVLKRLIRLEQRILGAWSTVGSTQREPIADMNGQMFDVQVTNVSSAYGCHVGSQSTFLLHRGAQSTPRFRRWLL